MYNIGMKIKELRKKKDMTQEKLANYLCVSYQAVSKWETGISAPDLSMILPIAKLFEVSVDELFGIPSDINDKRMEELREMWGDTWETGDTAKQLEISKTAVREYPGNFEFLVWLADAETHFATHNCDDGSKEQKEHFENAIKYYEMIIEDCTDTNIRNDAIWGYVMTLPDVGRRGEGIELVKQHPRRNELLEWCLTGEERTIHVQQMISHYLNWLVMELEDSKFNVERCKASENVIKAVIDDGNYLFWHDRLMTCSVWQAMGLTREKRYDEAIEALKKAYHHALEYDAVKDRAKIAPIPYTCQAFNMLKFDAHDITYIGMQTDVENFREYIRRSVFNDLQSHPEFAELMKL